MNSFRLPIIACCLLLAGCNGGGSQDGPVPPDGGAPGTSAPAVTFGPKPQPVEQAAWKSTPGGVKYAVLREGEGPSTQARQRVFILFTGWLEESGAVFDSSTNPGRPLSFILDANDAGIKGWNEGIRGMKPGETRQMIIPPDLAYGKTGTPDREVPPNAPLVCEVHLVRLGEVLPGTAP